MNDHVVLANGYDIAIKEGGSLAQNRAVVNTEEAAVEICNALMKRENLSQVEYRTGLSDETIGLYYDLMLTSEPYRYNEVGEDEEPTGDIIVVFGFREKTDIERRLDELEETQAIQDGAIEEIAEIVAEG